MVDKLDILFLELLDFDNLKIFLNLGGNLFLFVTFFKSPEIQTNYNIKILKFGENVVLQVRNIYVTNQYDPVVESTGV